MMNGFLNSQWHPAMYVVVQPCDNLPVNLRKNDSKRRFGNELQGDYFLTWKLVASFDLVFSLF